MLAGINWENAINTRRSTRSYEVREVDEVTRGRMKGFITEMEVPFKHDVKINLFKANSLSKLYMGIKPTPSDNVAFIAPTDILALSATGFVGEMFILYATQLGLATCWFGHYLLSELERLLPQTVDNNDDSRRPKYGYGKEEVTGERVIGISPLGYWRKEGLRLIDRATESFISYKRKSVGALLEGGLSEEELPAKLLYALDLARKAPSAANSQFWRFFVSPDSKTISIARPVGYKHIKWEHPDVDIGICACHFWLGLRIQEVDCRVSLKEEEGRAVWSFEL